MLKIKKTINFYKNNKPRILIKRNHIINLLRKVFCLTDWQIQAQLDLFKNNDNVKYLVKQQYMYASLVAAFEYKACPKPAPLTPCDEGFDFEKPNTEFRTDYEDSEIPEISKITTPCVIETLGKKEIINILKNTYDLKNKKILEKFKFAKDQYPCMNSPFLIKQEDFRIIVDVCINHFTVEQQYHSIIKSWLDGIITKDQKKANVIKN